MRIPWTLRQWLLRRAFAVMKRRPPDIIIGEPDYMRRWYLIPRNPILNVYLHDIARSDDDRALHDHPWPNMTILLVGMYVEHTIRAGGIHDRTIRRAGDIVLRAPRSAHRLELLRESKPVSLFITGPRLRQWGFHCPEAGWRHWRDFTAGDRGTTIGRGCGD